MDNFDLRKYLSNNPLLKENQDITSNLENAGFQFDDGILGGVGSGGGGYYDYISDKISGINLDKFNENEFNTWYDNISKDSLNSFTYEKENSEENEDEIDYDSLKSLKPGIYDLSDYGGFAEIHSNGDITLYAQPTLSDPDGDELKPIFSLNSDGSIKILIPKEQLKQHLQQNLQKSGSWGII